MNPEDTLKNLVMAAHVRASGGPEWAEEFLRALDRVGLAVTAKDPRVRRYGYERTGDNWRVFSFEDNRLDTLYGPEEGARARVDFLNGEALASYWEHG